MAATVARASLATLRARGVLERRVGSTSVPPIPAPGETDRAGVVVSLRRELPRNRNRMWIESRTSANAQSGKAPRAPRD